MCELSAFALQRPRGPRRGCRFALTDDFELTAYFTIVNDPLSSVRRRPPRAAIGRVVLDYNRVACKTKHLEFLLPDAKIRPVSLCPSPSNPPKKSRKCAWPAAWPAEVLDYIGPLIKPGMTTAEIDRLCHEYMVNVQGATPAPLNYAPPGYQPYPKSICTSVNHVVCHGVPGEKKLKPGDIVNIDITVIKDGYHGDTSRMFYVGQPSIQARRLCDVTYECMWRGIEAVKAGAHLGDIGHAIQTYAEAARLQRGARILRARHRPQIPRRAAGAALRAGRHRAALEAGMIFTVEPMINAGKADIRQLADGWTIVTKDHSLSAQWEHTVLVTADGL